MLAPSLSSLQPERFLKIDSSHSSFMVLMSWDKSSEPREEERDDLQVRRKRGISGATGAGHL